MEKTIKARFSKGLIEPLEKLDFKEGEEIIVIISEIPLKGKRKSFREALRATAGGWKDLVDCEDLKRNIYNDRLIATRPEVKL